MKPAKLVQLLSEALERQGYKFRNEKGNFRGGSCVFETEKLVIINKRFGDEERAEILARALARMDLDNVYLLPELRDYVEQFSDRPMIMVDLSTKAEESSAQ